MTRGLILDTSIFIAAERRRQSTPGILSQAAEVHGDLEIALSTVTVVELTHGIYRASKEVTQQRRRLSVQAILDDMTVYPLSLEIALLAGRIEGQQAALGNRIAFEDLVIGATALYLNFAVATLNLRHFQRIPDLQLTTF